MINRAKFLQNGSCGFVLKPEICTLATASKRETLELTIRLISGYHLPNARQSENIIEPYVKIRIHVHPNDSNAWCSQTVPKNGFNPIWNEETRFKISNPEHAIVEFKVILLTISIFQGKEYNNETFQVKSRAKVGEDDYLGSYFIALSLIRKGYRNISLENYDGKRLTPAGLFVHINI